MRSVLSSLLFLSLASCATNTGIGVISGAALGGSLGGVIRGTEGALVCSAAGVVAGSLIGTALDLQDRKVMEKSSPRTIERMDRGEPLTIGDVIKLSQSGVADETIIHYIRDTGSNYTLSQAQIRRLQDAGVSSRVVDYMVDTGR